MNKIQCKIIPYTSRSKFDDKIFVKMKSKCLIEKPANRHYKFSFIIDFTYLKQESTDVLASFLILLITQLTPILKLAIVLPQKPKETTCRGHMWPTFLSRTLTDLARNHPKLVSFGFGMV